MLQGKVRGGLLSLLFGKAFGFGDGDGVFGIIGKWGKDAYFDPKMLLVVGSGLGGENVAGLALPGRLEVFLESGFVIPDGSRKGIFRAQGGVKGGQRRLDDVPADEGASGLQAAIQKERRDHGFKGVGEDCGFVAASAEIFATAKAEERTEADAGCHLA